MRYRNDLIKEAIGNRTLFEIAVKSGISPNTVGHARDGRNLSVDTLAAIAGALELPMRELFNFDRVRNTPRLRGEPVTP